MEVKLSILEGKKLHARYFCQMVLNNWLCFCFTFYEFIFCPVLYWCSFCIYPLVFSIIVFSRWRIVSPRCAIYMLCRTSRKYTISKIFKLNYHNVPQLIYTILSPSYHPSNMLSGRSAPIYGWGHLLYT